MTNVLRGHVVEAIVASALEPTWRWCAEDYSSWDFERADGLRLEVKQSAARQTWATSDKSSSCSFDIAERTGRWEGPVWVEGAGRASQIYILAHHPVADATADDRNPGQWRFHVLPAAALPTTKRISLASAAKLTVPVEYNELASAVEEAAGSVITRSDHAPMGDECPRNSSL